MVSTSPRRGWVGFIGCVLLACGVGWVVDFWSAPGPVWSSRGSYADIEAPLVYSRPWLVTMLPGQKQLNVWDLSSSSKRPVRSAALLETDGRHLHGFGRELIDDEFYFLEQRDQPVGKITELKKWNVVTGQLSTVSTRSSSSGRSQVLLSRDGSRMFCSEEMQLGALSLLAPPSLSSVATAGFVDWCRANDKTCFVHPQRVEVIDCRSGKTVSRFVLPVFNELITENQISSDGKWLACAGKLPSLWLLTKKVLDFSTVDRHVAIYDTTQGTLASTAPYGKHYPLPMKWVGPYFYMGKSMQASYHGESITYMFDGTTGTVLVDPTNGEVVHEYGYSDEIKTSYQAGEKLVFNTTGSVVEVDLTAGRSLKDAFAARRVTAITLTNPADYQMQLIDGTTRLAMFRHAGANSRWPAITSFLFKHNLMDWSRYLPEYHSIEVYDYATGQQRELIRSTSVNQDIGLSSRPSSMVMFMKYHDQNPEYQLWSGEISRWSAGYSMVVGFVVLVGLLWWTGSRRSPMPSQVAKQ